MAARNTFVDEAGRQTSHSRHCLAGCPHERSRQCLQARQSEHDWKRNRLNPVLGSCGRVRSLAM